ncbi:hypothetical protein BS47DRAFT_7670 [Hydnum rufescens UP504]|uniref:Uncharacterized protein n=1 Tax=Hydnum rufescens UP504 TaxID=1448309 RepID=A0A9P6BCX3_9AGAM|nr:hypothetical protein BS47DRAFT_7670 [Hydnum rufescens UP504]
MKCTCSPSELQEYYASPLRLLTEAIPCLNHRDLHPISALHLDPEPSGTLRRRLSIIHRLRNYDEEVYVFTQDLKMALDRFRTAALPRYTTSTIEMTMLSLGLTKEFSRPGLLPFLNVVVSHKRLIDHRLGTVQSIRLYRGDRPGHSGVYEFLLVGLVNKRGIENWVRLELQAGIKRGEVDFATKPEKLIDDTAATRERIIVGDQFLMTRLAMEIKAICENEDTSKYSARTIFKSLASHGRTVSTSISTRKHRELFALPLPPIRDL